MTSVQIVQIKNTLPAKDELTRIFLGDGMRALMEEIGKDMGDQMRKNILVKGGPGGAWPPLSGFGKGMSKRDATKARKAGNASASRHDGYAKRKDLGQTPGHGSNGADVRLRDTGELYAAVTGVASRVGDGFRVEATALGAVSGRPDNATLLAIHAEGKGRMPKRDPTEDMAAFEKRVAARIQSYISKMLKINR